MEANELRIGNLITARYQDDYAVNQVVVNAVSEIGVNRIYGETEFYIENCEPIPLTEEWLVRCGFNKPINPSKGFENSFSKGNFIWTKERFYLDAGNDEGWIIDEYKIQYVHQLQNLYFALTGDELVIK